MSWRHRIAAVVLLVLVGLPVGGAICAVTCETASTEAAAHHGAERECADAPRPPIGSEIGDASPRDCSGHDRALRAVPTTPAERADLTATSAPSDAGSPIAAVNPRHHTPLRAECASPPSTAPPSISRVVLRV